MSFASSQAFALTNLRVTVGESVVASAAATLSALVFEVPVWAMFIGWIAYFTHGINLRDGLVNFVCVLIGIVIGSVAAMSLAALTPHTGAATLSIVVFAVAVVVLSLRFMPTINNLLAYFLGLVAYFASHMPPSIESIVQLGIAALIGTGAGWLASAIHRSWGVSHGKAA